MFEVPGELMVIADLAVDNLFEMIEFFTALILNADEAALL
jgi:hypothetical protein